MSLQVQLRSKEQILADLIRSILINTDLNDVSPGSSLGTLLEAIASSHFQIAASALKILESSSLESLVGVDLDKKAASIKLPNGVGGIGRKPAIQAVNVVTIGSNFEKISAKQYAGKPAPFAGGTKLYLEDASKFPAPGPNTFIYIGRGTVDRFEGPILYTSLVNSGSFWEMTLANPLTKNHIASDLVVLAQGGDRVVPAGTTVQVPASNNRAAIQFRTTEEIVILDGESSGTVQVACTETGEIGNVLAGSITEFVNPPFSGATVINNQSFNNGSSSESDEDLRIRIKNYPATLSRGTATALLSALQGAVDPVTGRSIQSAIVLEPVEPGDSARIFIDDNTGLEPSFEGKSYELLRKSSSGQEKKFRSAKFPITPAVAIGANFGPFSITEDMTLTVTVDEITETYTITPSNYKNLISVNTYEISRDFNSQSNIVGFRTIDEGTRIAVFDLSGKSEILKISPGVLQNILGLPTTEIRPIFLYKNSVIQSFRGKTATLEMRPKNLWATLSPTDVTNVRVNVDGIIQTFTINDSDFAVYGANMNTATVAQWAEVLRKKVAGVKFTVVGQIIIWSSWQQFSSNSYLEILKTKEDGNPAPWIANNKCWLPEEAGGKLKDQGFEKDFKFNRFTGEISFEKKPEDGSTIEIASQNTRAFIRSKESGSGLFDVSPSLDYGNSRFVVGFDGDFAIRQVSYPNAATIRFDIPTFGSNMLVKITANNTELFQNAQAGDYLYLVKNNNASPIWSGANIEGIYLIKKVGNNKYINDASFTGLSVTTGANVASLTINITRGSLIARVTQLNHGLKSGDKITINASGPAGGLTAAEISNSEVPVVVINENNYEYKMSSTNLPTSDASIGVSTFASSVVTVTHTNHGLKSGAEIDINSTTLTSKTVAQLNTPVDGSPSTIQTVEVVDVNTYRFSCNTAGTASATPDTGTINLTHLKDCHIYIYRPLEDPLKSQFDAVDGNTYGVLEGMINIFKSTVIPQIVDLGTSSTLNVDDLVIKINENMSAGTAEKISPRQIQIRSNNFENGTVAILALVGNIKSVFQDTAIAQSIQPHKASAKSGYTGSGFPVIKSYIKPGSNELFSRKYLKTDKDLFSVLSDNINPNIESSITGTDYPVGFDTLWMTGNLYKLRSRIYQSSITFPYAGILSSSDTIRHLKQTDAGNTEVLSLTNNLSVKLQDVPITDKDKLVIEMDLNPTDKTVAINMAKKVKIATITASPPAGKGSLLTLTLKDPEDSDKLFSDPTSPYKNFNFNDFKILAKNVGVFTLHTSKYLFLRSASYGAPSRLHLIVMYPTEANEANLKISHSNDYWEEDTTRTTLIITNKSGNLVTTQNTGSYRLRYVGVTSGNHEFVLTSGTFDASSVASNDLINFSGVDTPLPETFAITASEQKQYLAAAIDTTTGSNIVTVTATAHGLATGDLVTITTNSSVGGISALNLTVYDAPVTVLTANTFTYEAGANATSTTSGTVDSLDYAKVTFLSPSKVGFTVGGGVIYSAASNNVKVFKTAQVTMTEIVDLINNYLPDNKIATAEKNEPTTSPFTLDATYITSTPPTPAFTGDDLNEGFKYRAYKTKYSGYAGIREYDTSTNVFTVVLQTDDTIFPTATETVGTGYSAINEECYIVPTNTNTLRRWLDFNAASSLNVLANVDKVNSEDNIQFSSKEDGESGAIKVTGVSANKIETPIIGNPSTDKDSTIVRILSAEAKAIPRESIVKIKNNLLTEIERPLKKKPTGAAITAANTVDVDPWFRQTNALKYIKISANKARIIFVRDGKGPSQSEHLIVGDQITTTNMSNGNVKFEVTSGSSILSARVGEMMYIKPDSPFPLQYICPLVPEFTKSTLPEKPEYIGYPVIDVINDKTVVVNAPNITTYGTYTLTSTTDIMFLPTIFYEKNIRTDKKEGPLFKEPYSADGFKFFIKTLGNGFCYIGVLNKTDDTDADLLLKNCFVNTDDYLELGNGFDPLNQGRHRIVSHNEKNHIIFYNKNGGKDEIFDLNNKYTGATGKIQWNIGPISSGEGRSIRILDSDCVKIGDFLRISSPTATTQWFNQSMIGTWKITGIGFQAINYAGPLPHSQTNPSNTYDIERTFPYVEIEMPNAPQAVLDSTGAPVDMFLIGLNKDSIGFIEKDPIEVFRYVVGHNINAINNEENDLFLAPNRSSGKMASVFGTVISVPHKINYLDKTFVGLDGYKVFSGLVGQAHKIIDGLPSNINLFPGVKAAGTIIEVLPPLIKSIEVDLQVRPKDGVTINSISDLIKATVERYINGLGVGKPVVLSEIIRAVQGLPGVFSVTILATRPAAVDDRIVVGETEKPFVVNIFEDISVG